MRVGCESQQVALSLEHSYLKANALLTAAL